MFAIGSCMNSSFIASSYKFSFMFLLFEVYLIIVMFQIFLKWGVPFVSKFRLFSTMAGKIGTHNGKFHCDEVFACSMLKRLPQFKEFPIVRSRDPSVLSACDIVVDVGGVYDDSTKRYDHHQKEFTHTMQTLNILDFNTKLSSAGLVYAHYGKNLIAEILGLSVDDRMIPIFYRKLYETFVEQIDAVDNGIAQYEGTPKYHSSGGISGRVGRLNPHWNEGEVDPDERFQQAMQLIGGEFESAVMYLYKVWWPARELVEQAINNRFEIDNSGRVILLENGGVPWKEHFFTIEDEKELNSQKITYMLFQDTTSKGWRIQAIPTNSLAAFDNRMPLPKEWRSMRDDELSKISGIPNCVFVHTSGFIGGNQTREGAIEMAKKAIAIGDEVKAAEMETTAKKIKLDESNEEGTPITA